jgi:hypothetical protein
MPSSTRPLTGEWPYLWLDATYLKQREGGRIVDVAAIIAVAVDTEGRREIVGLHIGPSEAETAVVQTPSADSYAGHPEQEKLAWTSWSARKSRSRVDTSTVRSSCCACGGIFGSS